MKLIDLLKQKLPKWESKYNFAAQDEDGVIEFYKNSPVIDRTGRSWIDKHSGYDWKSWISAETAEDWNTAIVTREQYEAWLPPVGTECEYQDYKGDWHKIFIIARYGDGTFIEWRSSGIYTGCDLIRGEVSPDKVRPIRTERDKAIDEMLDLLNAGTQLSLADAIEQLYDAGYRKQ